MSEPGSTASPAGPESATDTHTPRDVVDRAASLSFLLLAAALPWSIAPMSIGVVLCAALTLLAWWLPGDGGARVRWYRTPIDVPALVWMAALVIATIFALEPARSAPRIEKGLLFAVIPLAAWHARDPRTARRAVAILLVSAVFATIYALVRFEHEGGAFPARVRGLVGHPLTYGGQATLLATIAMALVLFGPDRRWRVGGGAFLVLLLPALLGSGTRSAWIATFAAACVLIARRRARWLAILGALAVAGLFLLPSGYRSRALSWRAFDPNAYWNQERLYLWDAGRRMFLDHPVTGVGLQDLSALYDRYKSPNAHESHGHLHDVVIQVGATMGVVGLVALVFLVTGFFRAAGRDWRAPIPPGRFRSVLRAAAVAALTGFLVAGIFEWNLGDEELVDFLCVVIGMGYAASLWPGTMERWPDRPRSS
ncbi:MAG: O-antigen ligase family protein [Hyphomicrobiales bacterium]